MSYPNGDVPPSAAMLPSDEKLVVIKPSSGVGKVLVREDTILANLPGCAGCGKAHFTCTGMKNQWSNLCWGKTDRKYNCLIFLLSATFVVSLIGTILFCSTNTVNNIILYNMVIKNNTMAYTMWRKPTVKPLMKVYLFNYTNWEEVRSGVAEKLHVEEVGPFVYSNFRIRSLICTYKVLIDSHGITRLTSMNGNMWITYFISSIQNADFNSQQLERVNVKFKDDLLAYQEKNTFTYLPEKSRGAQFDQVTVPNLPLLGVSSLAINLKLNSFALLPLSQALRWANHPDAFIKLPVHRFLWGYDDSIINSAKPILSLQGRLNFDQFGLLVLKNGTNPDRLVINTGAKDIEKMNIIEQLNGLDHMNYWGNPACNSVEGSDGTIFPISWLDRNTTLKILFPNLCRRLPFVYEKDVELSNQVKLLRYRLPINVFDSPETNPDNQCYCEIDTGVCPPRGLINITACNMGAPVMISFPHFYLGDPYLREQITGLKPDPVKHETFLDIHPTLGISLNGKSALQLNVQVKKVPSFSSLGFLKQDTILPVAWIDMAVEEIPEDIQSLVYHGTYSTAAAQLGLTVTCILALIISGLCLLIMFIRRKRKPCAVVKIPECELKPDSNFS